MNHHRPDNWEEWPGFEFVGKRFQSKRVIWIRARHNMLNRTYFYNFNEDMFYCKSAFDDYK